MAGGTVKSPVVGRSRRVVISTDRIAGTQPLPLKGILQNLRKPAAYLDETSEGALVSGGGRVDEYPDGGRLTAEVPKICRSARGSSSRDTRNRSPPL